MSESLGCAACGDCCAPVRLSTSPARLREIGDYLAGGGRMLTEERLNAEWMLEHFTALAPTGDDLDAGLHPYSCDAFDPESRLCTAHERRPPLCSGYPWYGRDPGAVTDLASSRCSYWRDLPLTERPRHARPLIPITVVGRGPATVAG